MLLSTLVVDKKDNVATALQQLEGKESIKSVGEKIFKEILEVASGKTSRAEIPGRSEFSIDSIGPTI